MPPKPTSSSYPPPRLRPGDKVALIAPASGQKKDQQELPQQAMQILQSWGLEVVITPTQDHCSSYLSADDACRADDLRQALNHPEVKAVFATRGGYGCARLLPLLTAIDIPSPRYLVGFSDITTLHLHFAEHKNLHSLHAPNIATQQFLTADKAGYRNRHALHQALFHGIFPTWQLHRVNAADTAVDWQRTGVTGGCLSLLVTSMGTPHSLVADDKILLIEDVGEAPYKIDRLLTHLKNAGKFESAKAVIFGDLTRCDSPAMSIDGLLKDFFAAAALPVFRTAGFGHGGLNLPWLYYQSIAAKIL